MSVFFPSENVGVDLDGTDCANKTPVHCGVQGSVGGEGRLCFEIILSNKAATLCSIMCFRKCVDIHITLK